MGCMVAIFGFFMPRLTLACLWAFTDYTTRGFEGRLWPILGWLLMPYTTICYLAGMVNNGRIEGWWLALVIVGVLADIGQNSSD